MSSLDTLTKTGRLARQQSTTRRAQMLRHFLLLAGTAATSIACGGAAVPNPQLTGAESAVRAAEVGGAEELPRGELHLKYARDAIAEARTLMDKGDNKQATFLLEKANVDAEKALALAEEEEARLEAEDQLKRIKEMMGK
jgi:hypothetical protein